MKCFVLVAGTGEYSDRSTWPCAVFLDEALAREKENQLTAAVQEFGEMLHRTNTDRGRSWRFPTPNEIAALSERFATILPACDVDGLEWHCDFDVEDATLIEKTP